MKIDRKRAIANIKSLECIKKENITQGLVDLKEKELTEVLEVTKD